MIGGSRKRGLQQWTREVEDNCGKRTVRTEVAETTDYLVRLVDLQTGLGALEGGPVQAGLRVRLVETEPGARGGAAA